MDSAASQRVFATGHQVGEIARTLYDLQHQGSTIDLMRDGVEMALKKTRDLLSKRLPIFEAGFAADGVMSFADVLLPASTESGDEWRMVEVKSSTGVKDYYYDDAAIQAYAARRSGLKLQSVCIAHIDRNWTYQGDGNYFGLLKEVDLTDQSFSREAEVAEWVEEAKKIAALPAEPEVRIGAQCAKPFECGFHAYCTQGKKPVQHPIAWLPNVRSRRLLEFIENNHIQSMTDVPDDFLNEKQRRVKAHTLSRSVYFDREAALAQLQLLTMPLYFLDFEAVSYGIPAWKGRRPYEQVPFQFSLHSIDDSGVVTHKSFLDISGDDPTRQLSVSLIEGCGTSGSILVYNAAFEKSRIQELISAYPEYAKELTAIISRMFDLLPLAEKVYYHPAQEGSWSIKKVLPAIAPDLDYDNLDGVKDGVAAIAAFLEATNESVSPERKEEIRRQLEGVMYFGD